MQISDRRKHMPQMAKRKKQIRPSPSEIEGRYDTGEFRLAQEKLDFILPQIRDFVQEKKWLNLRPEYQRRLVWDRKKKSRFIESLLMNVPIPPIFLFEFDLNRYEVMDGQQRLNAVLGFYENDFALRGLSTWSVLNGLRYKKLPPRIQRGLDRRRIAATVLLAESAADERQRASMRREVFERLNTGGLTLKPQELRNAMFAGPFNDLLLELAGDRLFNEIWGIPPYDEHYRPREGFISSQLANNKYFQRMRDCQIVLRYFAFRRVSRVKGAARRILDECMKEFQAVRSDELVAMREAFVRNLTTARGIFGDRTFQLKVKGRWKHSEPMFDAVMCALDRVKDHETLLNAKATIVTEMHAALEDDSMRELLVGKPNTAQAIKDRIDAVEDLFLECA